MIHSLLCALPLALGGEVCEREHPLGQGKLIVHEWGTFTSLSGADGVHLEFRTEVGQDLPDFVYDRSEQARESLPGVISTSFFKPQIPGMVRMETPVIYFYTGTERKVDVLVGFPNGLITEFFPPASEMAPAFAAGERARGPSELGWRNLWLLPAPEHRDLLSRIPPAPLGNHYSEARETDAAIVRFVDNHFGDKYEKFLVYRGVGDFRLPLQARAEGNDRFVIENRSPSPLRALFLVEVRNGRLRFSEGGVVEAGKTVPPDAASGGTRPEAEPGTLRISRMQEDSSPEELKRSMVKALRREGLYEKEAEAMVRIWDSSWFAEEGTRVFYVLPPTAVDKILPLHIEPRPDVLKRVFVGRLEILTPEKEREIEALVERNRAGALGDLELKDRLAASLGRFGEAALERILAKK